jgi:hypothetical protein
MKADLGEELKLILVQRQGLLIRAALLFQTIR